MTSEHSQRQAPTNGSHTPNSPLFIHGRGEMADLVRAQNWAATPLGPLASWPESLRCSVNLMLETLFPCTFYWGPEMIQFYNDAYLPLMGVKHPKALGQRAEECWPEAWEIIGPQLQAVLDTGERTYRENIVVPIARHGHVQNIYWTYSYSPIYLPDGAVGGIFVVCHDTTEQVVAEQKLRESEARANRILKSIGDAVIVTDADTRVTRINAVAEALTGWTEAEANGHLLADVFHIVSQDTREVAESPADKVKRLGTVVGLANHTILIAKDGTETYIDDSGAPIRGDDGQLTGIVLVFRDITEQRREAEALRESQARLSAIYATSASYIGLLSPDGRIVDCNRAALAFANSNVSEVTGVYFWDGPWFAYTDGAPEMIRQVVAKAASGQSIRKEMSLKNPSGENISFDFSIAPVYDSDGKVLYLVPEAHDISVLKVVEAALAASKEELRWTVELSTPVPWTADTEGNILDFSRGWVELTGIEREKLLGEGWMQVPHPDDVASMAAAWARALRTGEPYDVEHRIHTASGEFRWMRSRAFPRRDEAGNVVKWYGTTEDIDERKRAENALIRSEKLAAVGRLAASIAHEINNPLEAVFNLLYLAEHSAEPSEIQSFIHTAERELRRVSAITSQTLRFYKQSSSPRAVNASELIDSVFAIYQGRIVNSRIEVVRRELAAHPVVCFDGEIRQVLLNLIGNAIDAMHPQGGTLTICSREATCWITGKRGIRFTIADTGTGMDQKTLARVFEPFFTTKGFAGTGLGLWVSQEIVERHHGRLKVRSSDREPHTGTVFSFFLPFIAVPGESLTD